MLFYIWQELFETDEDEEEVKKEEADVVSRSSRAEAGAWQRC